MKIVEHLYLEKCKILCEKLSLIFIGFRKNQNNKRNDRNFVIMHCIKHGHIWSTTNIGNFIHRQKNPCPLCVKELKRETNRKPLETVIEEIGTACKRTNNTFVGWEYSYENNLSMVKIRCNKHGTEFSNVLSSFLIYDCTGCSDCQADKMRVSAEKNNQKHIDKFLEATNYPEGTTFERSPRKTPAGVMNYWFVNCGACKKTSECFIGTLKAGSRPPCGCPNVYSKRYLYLLDLGDYVKYGITKDPRIRVSTLENKNKIKIKILRIYDFGDETFKCQQTESLIKKRLKEMPIKRASKRVIPDGHTESHDIKYLPVLESLLGEIEMPPYSVGL